MIDCLAFCETAVLIAGLACSAAAIEPTRAPARGPLRVLPSNPRHFTHDGKRAVYLTGAHTWNNLVDIGRGDPPQPFDFDAYLGFLEKHGHNFIRMWAWDSTTWDPKSSQAWTDQKDELRCSPQPWPRSGPGNALDGVPKFDLSKHNQAYFDRLRARVRAAGQRGIYVSVMLFEGWGLMHGNLRAPDPGWAWRSHPFHRENNVNGINGDVDGDARTGEVHRLANPAVSAVQAAYIRKVVDTVNDLDNVLYEVINEGGQKEWGWWVVHTIHAYERTKRKQHPVGITGHGAEGLASMLASPADWVSPGSNDGFGDDPPAWDGKKVSLLDTDHVWGIGGRPAWVWKSFLRGHNPLFMDPYDNRVLGKGSPSRWDALRAALGHARRLAERVNLAAMVPRGDLASTGYCLADPGKEYIVYLPNGGEATVDLAAAAGKLAVEWVHPTTGTVTIGDAVASASRQTLRAPFSGDAVVHLTAGTPRPIR